MFSFLSTMMPTIAGGIFTGVMKYISNKQQIDVEKHQMMMEAMTEKNKQINILNEYALKNKGFSFMRRTIAFLVTLAILSPIFYGLLHPEMVFNIISEVEVNESYFFGLFETTETKEIVITTKGAVFLPVVADAFGFIIGMFFGNESMKRY